MGELGIVLVVDESIEGFSRAAKLINDGWTSLWSPTLSTIVRWKSFLTDAPQAIVVRFDQWNARAEAQLRDIQAECDCALVVQLGKYEPAAVMRLHALGVNQVLPMLCSPTTLEAALINSTWNEPSHSTHAMYAQASASA